jgi:hypothetical protein
MSHIFELPAALNNAPPACSDSSSAAAREVFFSAAEQHHDEPLSRRVVFEASEFYDPKGSLCCFVHVVTVPCFAPFWPCCLLDALGCFGEVDKCGCRAMVGETRQTIEIDHARRMVTLCEYKLPYCSCEWGLVIEQEVPFDRIDGFKCVKSAVIGLDSDYVAVLAVKRLLKPDPKKTRFVPSATSRAPPYTWPFFIDRAIFEGGDLLLLSVWQSDAVKKDARNLQYINSEKEVCVSADAERLLPIVGELNMRLSQVEAA